MDIRFTHHPEDAKKYDTEKLRNEFLVSNMMEADKINLTYSHYDRFIVGGIMPVKQTLKLEPDAELRADYFLERREMGIVNIGGAGTVTVDGEAHTLNNKDCLFVGKGKKDITFKSNDGSKPAKYFVTSCPAHAEKPVGKVAVADVEPFKTGSSDTCNERSIYKMIHNDGLQSCQLVMGMTMFSKGSIWNTMPAHTHGRRMEAYFYFDMDEDARMFHLMGEPKETRHLVMANEEAVISPTWSIHSGVATASYSFIWAMAGENKDYTDMDVLQPKDLK